MVNSHLVVTFLLICISPSAIAQWHWQNPLPQGNNLNAVSFITPQTGYAVGEKGTIIKTTDGGIHWQHLGCGSTGDFNSLWFKDVNHGWVAGSHTDYFGATIYYTENGGLSWEVQYTSTLGYGLHDIAFTDALHGFAVGSINDGILVTHDGGNTWIQGAYPNLPDNLKSIFFLDDSTGWIGGTGDKIYKTTDQGGTWTGWPIPGNTLINCVFFSDSQVGYAVGSGTTILKSVNGGQTWSVLSAGVTGSNTFNDVCFINPDTGWVTGSDYFNHGLFLQTFNGGLTWQNDSSLMVFEGKDITFIDSDLGWCTGNNGFILGTSNGGASWTSVSHRITGFFSRVQFLDTLNGWISGKTYQDWGDPFTGGIVSKTGDGGWNWETTWTDTAYMFTNMQFFTPDMGREASGTGVRSTALPMAGRTGNCS